jgi:hypothetical protein
MKRLRLMAEEIIKNGKEVATNGNGLGVGLKLKNYKSWLSEIGVVVCRNPSLGLVTKARGCKVAGQEGSSGVMPHAPGSARECEGISPHTPKGTPTLGVGVLWTFECSKSDYRGQNPMD